MVRSVFRKSAIALSVLLYLASCSDASLETSHSVKTELTATTESAVVSRTGLSGISVIWNRGDVISLLSSGANDRFAVSGGINSTVGKFSGTATGNAPYYALYPYNSASKLDGDTVRFNLPQVQTYKEGGFATGAFPMMATSSNLSEGLSFRNLCGLLRLELTGDIQIGSIELKDCSGKNLWGDCALAVDGKQGTSDQTLSVSGGTNCLTLKSSSGIALNQTPKVAYFVVPAGTLGDNFQLTFYTISGEICGYRTARNAANKIERSVSTNMPQLYMHYDREPADPLRRGYYKDVFMDSGMYLTSRTSLPAATYLGYSFDFFCSADDDDLSQIDIDMQRDVFVGTSDDLNGSLLYPDGAPRYRMIYVNGGQSNNHGKSLGEDGRSSIKAFVTAGGSYVGTCAGALLASKGYDSYETTTEYLALWPGHVYHTGMSKTYTSIALSSNSTLLNYYNFGGDGKVADVYHNGGCYMDQIDHVAPRGTEVLATFSGANSKSEGKPAIWSYKASDKLGRLVLCGSHPEMGTSGEVRDLMASMMLYAAAGAATPAVKGVLENGIERKMDKTTADNIPEYTGIGDLQYHHFTFDLPENAQNIVVTLSAPEGYDLHLSLRKGDFAYRANADYLVAGSSIEKTLNLDSLAAGTWYVSVYCSTSPTATLYIDGGVTYGYRYSGKTGVLNGVPYTLKASWN